MRYGWTQNKKGFCTVIGRTGIMQKGVFRCMMKLPKTQGGKFMKHKTITNKLVVCQHQRGLRES